MRAIARPGEPVEPLVLDDFEVEPAEDPVIGPELAAARTRLGLTVDQLAERTRIRPHVIEAIEVDDFEPCGGDFYARGHLRTLARVLGVDVAPLLASYDERYAHAPINPRRVFEAELATGANGSIRSTRGGPNWSVLVAVVMALVLCWSIARLVMDTPPELRGTTPVLNGSGGPEGAGSAPPADPVAVVVTAADRRRARRRARRRRRVRLQGRPRGRPDARVQGVAARARGVHRRCRHRGAGRWCREGRRRARRRRARGRTSSTEIAGRGLASFPGSGDPDSPRMAPPGRGTGILDSDDD